MDKDVIYACRKCHSTSRWKIKKGKDGVPIVVCSKCDSKHTLGKDGRLWLFITQPQKI